MEPQYSYPLAQWDFTSAVGALCISTGCFAFKINNFFPLVVHAWRYFLNYHKNSLIWFNEGHTHFSTAWHAKMSSTLSEPKVETSTLHPILHEKLAASGRACMQSNQLQTNSHVQLEDNSSLLLRVNSL